MIPAILLFTVAVLYRVLLGFAGNDLPNFAPVAAIALCGPFLFPRKYAIALPLLILLVSDIALNWHYGAALLTAEMAGRYLVLTAVALLGIRLAKNPRIGSLLVASLASSTIFYIVTNSISWVTAPEYAKTVAGWVQALTVGVPGFPPTWVFFRNTLLGDTVFTLLFAGCVALARSRFGTTTALFRPNFRSFNQR